MVRITCIIMYMYSITLLLYHMSSCRMYVVALWAFGLLDLRIKLLTSYLFFSIHNMLLEQMETYTHLATKHQLKPEIFCSEQGLH